ncbi:hypothetical protein G6F57_018067 [Rhizopus arrhizus]|nr:hypothetical protein G6F57_018067 [Rhizopus arrhizus]
MITLADAATPPLRLPLGTDALRVIAEKNAYVAEETEAWKALAQSTDFPVNPADDLRRHHRGRQLCRPVRRPAISPRPPARPADRRRPAAQPLCRACARLPGPGWQAAPGNLAAGARAVGPVPLRQVSGWRGGQCERARRTAARDDGGGRGSPGQAPDPGNGAA